MEDARRIARQLVEQQLAACVNIVPGATSIYKWKGAIEEAAELLLIIKTSRPLFETLRTELTKIHPYEVPEIVAVPIVDGAEPYLNWIEKGLRGDLTA